MKAILSLQRIFQTVVRAAFPVIVVMQAASFSAVLVAGDQIKLGRELFEHKWVPKDRLSPGGDGLGPMHNADSCVACHNLGGMGGAGPAAQNVELLSAGATGTEPTESEKRAFQSKAGEIHPAFSAGSRTASSVVLHKFGTAPEYERWRLSVLGFKLPADLRSKKAALTLRAIHQKQSNLPPVADLPRKRGLPLQLSQRNTPALFGAGLIDTVSEETLADLAKQQAQRFPGIQGRLSRTAEGKVGRFGWRGQIATLREFVLSACAMELGLQNADHPQALNPLDPRHKLPGNDLSPDQCDALAAFIASLPAPRQIAAADQQQANRLSNGERLFETVGCAGCHVRQVGNVQGIYSDLLLHDMGPLLEDPLPANPERAKVGTVSVTSGYGGGSVDVFADVPTRIRREWKTAPLWGVRDSAPYLHDGRANTLLDAIALHGGEAESSARRFQQLGELERSNILHFLQSLASPRSP